MRKIVEKSLGLLFKLLFSTRESCIKNWPKLLWYG